MHSLILLLLCTAILIFCTNKYVVTITASCYQLRPRMLDPKAKHVADRENLRSVVTVVRVDGVDSFPHLAAPWHLVLEVIVAERGNGLGKGVVAIQCALTGGLPVGITEFAEWGPTATHFAEIPIGKIDLLAT